MNLTVDLVPRPPAFYDVNNGSLFCMVNQCAASISYMIMLWKRVYKKSGREKKSVKMKEQIIIKIIYNNLKSCSGQNGKLWARLRCLVC
jgi:hypothetical protein